MKKLTNIVIVALTVLALTFATTSCKKHDKNEDPTPTQPIVDTTPTQPIVDTTGNGGTNNGGGTTNTAPTFTRTTETVTSNGTARTFALPVTDTEGNPISITGVITGASSNVTVSYSGLNVTITPNSNSITYAGVETLSVTITDGTTPITTTFTVNVGATAQITKYNMLLPFMNRNLQNAGGGTSGHFGTLYINTNGTMRSTYIINNINQNQPSGSNTTGFYNQTTDRGNWTMNEGGEITITTNTLSPTYNVTITNNGTRLLLSKTNNGTETYEFN